MGVKLQDLGGEMALVLDRQTWIAAGIDGETEIEVVPDGSGLHVRPRSDEHRERVIAAARRVMDAHEETLRKLAL